MIHFIVNPAASGGRGLRVWRRVQECVQRLQPDGYQYYLTEKQGDARRFSHAITADMSIADAIETDCHYDVVSDTEANTPNRRVSDTVKKINSTEDGGITKERRFIRRKLVAVIGGAGTLNEVIDGGCLDRPDVAFAYIPTSWEKYNFLQSVFQTATLQDRLQRILTDKDIKLLNYGVLSNPSLNRRFVMNAGVGFNAAVFLDFYGSECAARCAGRKGKYRVLVKSRRLLFLQSFIREFIKAKRTRGYVVIEDETAEKHEFNNILFASALVRPYGSGLSDCGKNSDERIEFCVVSTRHKLRLLRVIWTMLRGRSTRLDGVHIYRGKAMDIVLEQPLPAHVDGEFVGMQDRFTLRGVPKRLRVSM